MKKSIRNIKYLIIHCTATPEGRDHNAKEIKKWHLNQGWSDIGYHYVIKLDGTVEIGRDIDKAGAHTKNYNSESIGIVYVGGVDLKLKAKDTRTEAQKKALLNLLQELKQLYPNAIIAGHRDFPKVNKDCPSFDAKGEYKEI